MFVAPDLPIGTLAVTHAGTGILARQVGLHDTASGTPDVPIWCGSSRRSRERSVRRSVRDAFALSL
jgi:hypothetical protein